VRWAAQAARDALLQDLQDGGRRSLGWLANEQVNVLRQNDESNESEAVTVAYLAKDFEEHVSGVDGSQQRQAPVKTERHEMQMALPVAA
jgi:hypothetical protein